MMNNEQNNNIKVIVDCYTVRKQLKTPKILSEGAALLVLFVQEFNPQSGCLWNVGVFSGSDDYQQEDTRVCAQQEAVFL